MENKTELTAADLALYLGCEVLVHYAPSTERIGQLREVGQNGSWVRFELHTSAYKSHEIKPILRPLSDMTEGELLEFAKLCSGASQFQIEKSAVTNYKRVRCLFFDAGLLGEEWLVVSDSGETWYTSYFDQNKVGGGRNIINQHQQTVWLISNHFDIFGWIPAGLAIDKTKI
jgi:hypothetical protein